MAGRRIVQGLVGCPICRREYPIDHGVVRFGDSPAAHAGNQAPDAEVIWALLGLGTPGGFVVLVGSAVPLVAALRERLPGVEFVGMNPPSDLGDLASLSGLTHPTRIPLRHAVARGVVLGADASKEPWLSEGARVLLPGLRLVAVGEPADASGLVQLAAGNGLWVGKKT
jgi:hypothetical protein